MKKVLLGLTVSLFLTVAHGQTAVYHPFPDSNAVWVYNKTECLNPMSNPPCTMVDYHIYYYIQKGDTIYNSKNYHKLYGIDSSAVSPMSSLFGGLREDTNRRVYFTYFSGNESLLYDFSSPNIGDTLVYGSCFCPATIDSVDSVMLENNEWRTRYWVMTCGWAWPSSPVVEGIGCFVELMFGPCVGEFAGTSIRCFHNNDSLVYIYDTSSTASCYMNYAHVGIEEQKNNFSFSISPNPFSVQTVLQTTNPLHNATLTVDNCFGQTVAQIKNLRGQTIVFNRDNLASGLYFVRLTEENKTIAVDKLVITDK